MTTASAASSARFLDRSTPPHVGTLVLITALAAMQMNVLLPSLPAIGDEFQVDYAAAQLVVSGYLATTAIGQIVFGALSDRYGRRPVVLWGIFVFLAATLAGAVATSFEMLMVARVLQASVVSGYALSRAIVRDMVPLEQAASMLGYITMGMALVPMVSPMVGGYLEEMFSWRASFWLSAGLGLVTFVVVWLDLKETNGARSESVGAQFRSYPELLASRRFWGFTATSMFSAGTYFAFLGGGPYVAKYHLGLTPSQFGVLFVFLPLGYITGNFLSGRYATRFGVFPLLKAGAAATIVGIGLSAAIYATGYREPIAFFAPFVLLGVGNGLVLPSAMAGMVSVRKHLAGSASGLGGAMNVGGGAALSVFAGFLLTPTSGAMPLLLLMLAAAVASFVSAVATERLPVRHGDDVD